MNTLFNAVQFLGDIAIGAVTLLGLLMVVVLACIAVIHQGAK